MKNLLLLCCCYLIISCSESESVSENIHAFPINYNEETLPSATQTLAIKAGITKEQNPYNSDHSTIEIEEENSITLTEIETQCSKKIIQLVESTERVKEVYSEIKNTENNPSVLISDTPKTSENKDFVIKIGVDGELHFETILTLNLDPVEARLIEEDWLTGEKKAISFDKKYLPKLKEICDF